MARHALNFIIWGLIVVLFVMMGRGFLRSRAAKIPPVKSMRSWQQAQAPLGFPVLQGDDFVASSFDPRFLEVPVFERAETPRFQRMDYPLGTEQGGLVYNAQRFWEMNDRRGGHHSGEDLNGIGGMNTDLGDPVYAAANGRVVYRGVPSPGWGKVIILSHVNGEGDTVSTMYAHLESFTVNSGALVAGGTQIGTVGTADGRYLAHLHYELRNSAGVWIGPGYCQYHDDRIAAEDELKKFINTSAVIKLAVGKLIYSQ
ncbi:M23 family metallopeptidase [Persicirhabdus sediminis]|uniref:M23 family metallopeptidase n=1 Tax=Persicirhabdus sediminis TaxID=454144 RepID=A0A8J7MD14_9BACT|nr:M23 family metallopeptidase [Persicirhabdus sediminis]MBK1790288.1 M23 family metallopeptidase [Persicirhabdus sediminis]